MFFTYIARELRRRRRQALVVALGLALGIGLVVTVSAMAAGVRQAQATVLRSLYGVGTDVTVTRSAAAGSGGGARFALNPTQDQQGKRFSRDQILESPGLGTISSDEVAKLAALPHVGAVSGGLSLTSIHASGTFVTAPSSGSGTTGSVSTPGALPSIPPVNVTSYSIEGVDVTSTGVGPLTPSEIAKGRYFSPSETNAAVAVLDQSYAKQHHLAVGSTITIDGTAYRVIGIARSPTGGSPSNVYVPLARAQKMAGAPGKVNRIYVKATSASSIASVKAEIKAVLPKATVTTAKDLAAQVTGSLSNASTLAGNLGTWLSLAALIAAFAVASLL
ncbi:MAG TPA: ABC transporter permease, partial [Actinomycetota bacterium]|nr:ABC transporter permease [Actinomycetota bacterium]